MDPFVHPIANVPPARLKVFAPSGDTTEFTGWIAIRDKFGRREVELFSLTDKGKDSVLSKKVVILNQETGKVIYDPRKDLSDLGGKEFMTKNELAWLERNPHWPAVLELYDAPTEEKETDGLYPSK